MVFNKTRYKTWGESNSPRFTISVYSSSCQYLSFGLISLLFFLNLFRSIPPAFEMIINRKRMQMSEKKAEQEIITWTAIHRNCKNSDIRLAADISVGLAGGFPDLAPSTVSVWGEVQVTSGTTRNSSSVLARLGNRTKLTKMYGQNLHNFATI